MSLIPDHEQSRAAGRVAAEVIAESIENSLLRGYCAAVAKIMIKRNPGPWVLKPDGELYECGDQHIDDSIRMNGIMWRLADALGMIAPDQTEIVAGIDEVVDAVIERLRGSS